MTLSDDTTKGNAPCCTFSACTSASYSSPAESSTLPIYVLPLKYAAVKIRVINLSLKIYKDKGDGSNGIASFNCILDEVLSNAPWFRGSFPGLCGMKETKMFLPHPLVKLSIVGSLRDREVACSASDRQGLNFELCIWRAVSSHHPQEVLLARQKVRQ